MRFFYTCIFIGLFGIIGAQNIQNETTENSLLRFDGIYSMYFVRSYDDSISIIKKNNYFAISPFTFFYNNKIIMTPLVCSNDSDLVLGMKKYNVSKIKNMCFKGIFRIKNNKLDILMDYTFNKNGLQSDCYITHFEGEIKNKDTIINFRMIPPYPSIYYKKNSFLFNYNFDTELTPKMLVFKKFPEKTLIDSAKIELNPKTRK